MISVYLPGETFLHRLPAGAKLAGLCLATIIVLPIESPRVLGAVLLLVLGLFACLGREGLRQLKFLRSLSVLLAGLLALHIFSGTGSAGVVMVLRLLAMVLLATLVSLTTKMDDLLDALRGVLQPLGRLGLPEKKLALAIGLVLRFAPVLIGIGASLGEAYRARSGRKGGVRLIAPFALQALGSADRVAEALAARGGADGFAPETKDRKTTL
ncbi:energy-coupling factor transporter transmembrane protein EcfT [Stappia sp. F7233]|uniref:Energy-coupling factor transporter transmembrane protein EcfT n=1 Tax=Stappia albiluteola TaxID=2758565 RepID=A0A839AF59_9HYPH|nr:CbiQ family ECF transporter T component [Stappia albiluteola]MBA5777427.1 energy-coupling factor transporter transmembrane protein EcfT [Stappia albiluteola]